jgi:hypothetical protein
MISEKVWQAIKDYGLANRHSGPTEIRIARRKLEIEIEIYANEMAIEGLKRAAETQTGKEKAA